MGVHIALLLATKKVVCCGVTGVIDVVCGTCVVGRWATGELLREFTAGLGGKEISRHIRSLLATEGGCEM